MYPLFESIKAVDGRYVNLNRHQQRMDRSLDKLTIAHKPDLASLPEIPPDFQLGTVKCRVSYGETLGQVEFTKYSRKTINSIQQVECEPFDYSLKYQDRSKLDHLFQCRDASDEVLITIQGIITDTSYSNVVLYDGNCWYTPETPLLEGTQRALLLDAGKVRPAKIHIDDLGDFQKLVLINALLEFEPQHFMPVHSIDLWNHKPVIFECI